MGNSFICNSKCGDNDATIPTPSIVDETEDFDDQVSSIFYPPVTIAGSMDHESQIQIHRKARARGVIYGSSILETTHEAGFTHPNYPKSLEDQEFITKNLERSNMLFCTLGAAEKEMFVSSMKRVLVEANETVIEQGDIIANDFYFILSGTVSYFVDGKKISSASAGASFGELSLLYSCPRNASVKADTDLVLYSLSRELFRPLAFYKASDRRSGILSALKKVEMFKGLEDQNLAMLGDLMTEVHFVEGDVVFHKGDPGAAFYVVESGVVTITDIVTSGSTDVEFGPKFVYKGDCFGDRALITGYTRSGTATATSPQVTLLALDVNSFQTILGPLEPLMNKIFVKTVLLGLFPNANFEPYEISEMLAVVKSRKFKANEEIRQDLSNPSLYIINKGKILKTDPNDANKISVLTKGHLFGAEAFKDTSHRLQFLPQDSPVYFVEEDSELSFVSRQEFIDSLGGLDRLILGGSPVLKNGEDFKKIVLGDIRKLRLLGIGTFGKVWLVRDALNNPYALKAIEKLKIVKQKQIRAIHNEKSILLSLEHPFIVKLHQTLQDLKWVYLLMDFCQGGELFHVIHKRRTGQNEGVPGSDCKFYSSIVLSALCHLHSRSICFRDLKPENVMILADGYAQLVDFGFSKIVKTKTNTLCGTPEYLAPEIILSQGHDQAVDLWALGILVFEMLYGYSTFYPAATDQMKMFRAIVSGKFTFPSRSDEDLCNANGFISKLLVKKPQLRLGNSSNGETALWSHPFFDGMENHEVTSKLFTPPWVPALESKFDVAFFDNRVAGNNKKGSENVYDFDEIEPEDFERAFADF